MNEVFMSISTLPLSYCTNVHPGRSLAEVLDGLDRYTLCVAERLESPPAAGLWLARPVVSEILSRADGPSRFAEELEQRGLTCHTLNAFPYGDFHSDRVKENVYLPDWTQPERLEYTLDCAAVLAALLPEGAEGSISTMPLGFKLFEHEDGFLDRVASQLIETSRRLEELHEETGRLVRMAIEPEPLCLLETTAETLEFFDRLRSRAASAGERERIERHLGVCFDVCHQAVEFEDVAASIAALDEAGVRINKIHITCALELDSPAGNLEARRELAKYVEPRYLHQTTARAADGAILRAMDLTRELALEPREEFRTAEMWRVHFHVPVDAERLGPLRTTRKQLKEALAAAARLDYAPHLEVETYTWPVLPGEADSDLVAGLTRELQATHALVAQCP